MTDKFCLVLLSQLLHLPGISGIFPSGPTPLWFWPFAVVGSLLQANQTPRTAALSLFTKEPKRALAPLKPQHTELFIPALKGSQGSFFLWLKCDFSPLFHKGRKQTQPALAGSFPFTATSSSSVLWGLRGGTPGIGNDFLLLAPGPGHTHCTRD